MLALLVHNFFLFFLCFCEVVSFLVKGAGVKI